jgi:hypothetical protein
MSIEISRKNEKRLRAAAKAAGLSMDTCLEQMLDEHEELVAIAERAAGRAPGLSREEIRAKIERGVLQAERGEVVDGETFFAELLAELDEPERKRRAG